MRHTGVLLAAGAVVVAALIASVLYLLTPGSERSARRDVDSLRTAIADHVAATGQLPRVTVTVGVSGAGDSIWGPDWVVEGQMLPRADPSRAISFFVVGDPDRWCVEALYIPPTLFSDSSGEWVSAHGRRGDAGRVDDGRCGIDFALILLPSATVGVPGERLVIVAAGAPVGTCIENPFIADAAIRPRHVQTTACSDDHFGEVYFTGVATGSDFAAYEQEAADVCSGELEPFIGVPRNISAFTAEPFTVDEATWQNGDGSFSCFLYLSTEDYPLRGTARDSWR